MTTSDGRAFVKYVDEDGGEVSLPGYLDARPSIVEPGDVLSIREEFLDEITSTDRFVVSDEPPSVWATSTKKEIATSILDRHVAAGEEVPEGTTREELIDRLVNSSDKATLIAHAEELDRVVPEPPGPSGDNADDPHPGMIPSPDLVDHDEDDPEGSDQ